MSTKTTKYRDIEVKKARNAAIRIYSDMKWACRIKMIDGKEMLHLIDTAIIRVRKEIKIPEIANEQIRLYNEMVDKLGKMAGAGKN